MDDEGTCLMMIMIMIIIVGITITVMEMMINAKGVSWLPVPSVLLIIHPFDFCKPLSCAGSLEGCSHFQHALGKR